MLHIIFNIIRKKNAIILPHYFNSLIQIFRKFFTQCLISLSVIITELIGIMSLSTITYLYVEFKY